MPATAGIAGWVMRERQAILVRDASSDPRFYNRIDSVTGLTTHSVLAVPMIIKGEVSGVVEAINKAGGAFTEHDLEMLEVMAGSAAIAIENARLFKGEREQRELAETLRQVGAALVSTLDVATVLDRLLEQVSRVVLNDTANIMLLEGDHVRIVRRRGYDRFGIDTSNALIAYPVTSIPNLQQMIETGEPVVIHDTHTDPNWIHRSEGDGWQRSYAGAPVRVRGQVIGFLNVHSATPGFFDHTHAERLRAFANQAAIALENARLFEAEREQSRRLQQTQAQLIHAEKVSALGRLTASIAHEINNPLQAVQGCLTLAVEELDTGLRREKLARYLDMADKEIERIANIVRRTRDFYRPAREEMQPADVRVVLESVLELVGKQLQNSRITVEYDGYETWNGNRDLPIIQANPDHLKQLFLNLVLNAIDAMSADGGTLHIHTTSDQIKGQDGQLLPAVRIEISDTGEGIPPEILSRLFEPFVTTKKDGTGLGLSISYRIVEAHNGQITAKSQVGIGTTFTVLLPVSSG
jgi:signal transduction histidine kinase